MIQVYNEQHNMSNTAWCVDFVEKQTIDGPHVHVFIDSDESRNVGPALDFLKLQDPTDVSICWDDAKVGVSVCQFVDGLPINVQVNVYKDN